MPSQATSQAIIAAAGAAIYAILSKASGSAQQLVQILGYELGLYQPETVPFLLTSPEVDLQGDPGFSLLDPNRTSWIEGFSIANPEILGFWRNTQTNLSPPPISTGGFDPVPADMQE